MLGGMDATPICAARIGSSQTNCGPVDDFVQLQRF